MKDIETLLGELEEAKDTIRNLTEENAALERDLDAAETKAADLKTVLDDLARAIDNGLREAR